MPLPVRGSKSRQPEEQREDDIIHFISESEREEPHLIFAEPINVGDNERQRVNNAIDGMARHYSTTAERCYVSGVRCLSLLLLLLRL